MRQGFLEWVGSRLEEWYPGDPQREWFRIRPARRQEYGQLTTNAPALLAQAQDRTPKEAAEDLLAIFAHPAPEADPVSLDHVAYAPPGFLNFYLRETWWQDALRYLAADRAPCSPEAQARLQARAEEAGFEAEYARLRLHNQFRMLERLGYHPAASAEAALAWLGAPEETEFLKTMALAPLGTPARIPAYLNRLSLAFHNFFDTCPIRGTSAGTAAGRMLLLRCCGDLMDQCLENGNFL